MSREFFLTDFSVSVADPSKLETLLLNQDNSFGVILCADGFVHVNPRMKAPLLYAFTLN